MTMTLQATVTRGWATSGISQLVQLRLTTCSIQKSLAKLAIDVKGDERTVRACCPGCASAIFRAEYPQFAKWTYEKPE